jgi:two-component system cell cycle response regulator
MNDRLIAFIHAPVPGQPEPLGGRPASVTERGATDTDAALTIRTWPEDMHRGRVDHGARGVTASPLRVLMLVGAAAYAGTSLPVATGLSGQGSLPDLIFCGMLALTAAQCLLRVGRESEQRVPWALLGLGLFCWATGQTLVAAVPSFGATTGGFSPANAISLAFYPAACGGLVLLLRSAVKQFSALLWLDGLAGALAVSAVAAAFAFPPVLAGTDGNLSRLLTAMSFPLADLMLIAFVVFTIAMTAWRPKGSLGLVTTALLLISVADGFSLWWTSTEHAVPRTVLDSLWPIATVLIAEATVRRPVGAAPAPPSSGLRSLLLPLAFSAIALGLLTTGLTISLNGAGYELATAALAFLVLRMLLTAADNLQMARASRREALTDALTGLGNRRRLMLDLDAAIAASDPTSPTMLMLFDLDGFKLYNDTFGHPAGDSLLARLGSALLKTVESWGQVYRLGGDEFCALCRRPPKDFAQAVKDALEALSERGTGFSVTASIGSVILPEEADSVTAALQLADKRLYERKGVRRRGVESMQARDVLMQAVRERHAGLQDHLGEVGTLAQGVARSFGMDSETVQQVIRAAELHDIGKMAIPETILDKPGPLNDAEIELMRQHTIIGDRILAAAPSLRPVGALVRASHERWDGKGYPDGLIGEEIPLGSRIIAVCDAYDAMTSGRPYQSAVSAREAVAELRRCAGTQFDPAVVAAFADLVLGSAAANYAGTRAERNGALMSTSVAAPEPRSSTASPS